MPPKAVVDDQALAKQQLHIKEMERKATFEQTQSEIRRQKDALKQLRRENKELLSAKSQTAKSTGGGSQQGATFHDREIVTLQDKIFTLRRQYDDLKAANTLKASELGRLGEQINDLNKEGQPILTDESPLTQKIRMLENRLDKSLIKHNEAMAIRRTYEQIVKRLREERVGFDNQLAAIEKTLKAKEHDYLELQNMSHDAHHAKEIARAEVQQFKAAYAEERRQKKRELEDRKTFVQSRMDQTVKAEKALKMKAQKEEQERPQKEEEERRKRELLHSTAELRTEEEQERLTQYAEAYRKIKDVTRASTVDEVIAKFIAQEDTHKTLVELTREVQAKIDAMHVQRNELRRKVEESKYSGSGTLGSRRIVDEFETHLSESKEQLEKAKKMFEQTSHTFIGVKAGVEHLAEKLFTYRPEMKAPPISDETIVDVLKHCEQKLQMLVDEAVTSTETLEEVLAHAIIEMPPNNLRVKLQGDADDEEEAERGREGKEPDEGEDDPHDRSALKSMSNAAVDRETKKLRKRGRKKDEEA